ncbi:chemotaxis protein CheW [Legionella dresdenensis]|uniref:Chemotaxis protein CheW n=1 Tax=Legionella dresdenensis TaxID=450200 RepID=A0ABV8CH96_9GAMM
MTAERKICTFYVHNFFFGIDVFKIQEVIRFQEMTHVPLASDVISGLINMRGQIVTAIDMRKRLDFPPAEEKPTNIIVRTDDSLISLLVDGIGDVIDIPEDKFESPPENVKSSFQQFLKEVCQLDKQLLLILDIEQLLKIAM